jgi:hypothetical protein
MNNVLSVDLGSFSGIEGCILHLIPPGFFPEWSGTIPHCEDNINLARMKEMDKLRYE